MKAHTGLNGSVLFSRGEIVKLGREATSERTVPMAYT